MSRQFQIKAGLFLLLLVVCSSAQSTTEQCVKLSNQYTQISLKLGDLKNESLKIPNGSTTNFDNILSDIQDSFSTIDKLFGSNISFLVEVTKLFLQYNSQTSQTQEALKGLKVSLTDISGQLVNVQREIFKKINLLNKNSAMRNIDSSITLLQSILEAYSQKTPVDFYFYQQLCGDYLNHCNNAFIVVTDGLSDFIVSIKKQGEQGKFEGVTQYVIQNTLLISSLPVLIDLNTQLIVKMNNLNPASVQIQQYSIQAVIFTSYKRSLGAIKLPLYQYQNLSIQLSSFNDLTLSSNSLLVGIYRNSVGDQVQSITQSKVSQKNIVLSGYLIKSEWESLDFDYTWHNCPTHSFLRGFFLNYGNQFSHVEYIACNTYQNLYHDKCSEVDVRLGMNSWVSCSNDTQMVGFFRNAGDNISSITKLRCCSVTTQRPSNLSYLDSLTVVNSTFKSQSIVDFTNGSKGLVSYFTINSKLLQGSFQVGVRNGLTASSTSIADVTLTFDSPLKEGTCDQDSFLYGFQLDGPYFNQIEKLQCVKYENTYWETCSSQVIPNDENYWKCTSTANCQTSTIPTIARCADGSYLAGLRRNSVNDLYGLDRIFCCTITNTPGLYKK